MTTIRTLAKSVFRTGALVIVLFFVSALEAVENRPSVSHVAFTPDGKYLAACANGTEGRGTISLWDVGTKRLLWSRVVEHGIASFAMSPNNETLVFGTFNGEAKILVTKIAMLKPPYRSDAKAVRVVAFSPDGKTLAIGSDGRAIRLWDLESRAVPATLREHWGPYYSAAFSPDGTRLIAPTAEGVRIWDTNTGKEIRTWNHEGCQTPCAIFSPDGKWVLTGGSDETVRVWNVSDGKFRARLKIVGTADAMCFSEIGQILAVGGDGPSIQLYDLKLDLPSEDDLKEIRAALANLTNKSKDIREAANQSLLQIGFPAEAELRRSMLESPSAEVRELCRRVRTDILSLPRARLAGHHGRVNCVAFSPGGKILASGGADGTVRLWNMGTQKQIARLAPGGNPTLSGIFALAVSPNNQVLAEGYGDGTIRVWDSARLRQLQECKGHNRRILHLIFSPDGKTLYGSAFDSTIRAWNWAEGKETIRFPFTEGDALSLSLSPDGRTLAGAGGRQDGIERARAIHLWDTASGQETRQLVGHHFNVLAIAFSPDGKSLASASADRTVRLWDTSTGQEIRRLGNHVNAVGLLAFSPDGQFILAGLEYNPLLIWNTQTGKEVGQMLDNPPAASSLKFSPDGSMLAYINSARKIGLWEVDSGRPIRQIVHPPDLSTLVFTPDSKKLISAGFDVLKWDLVKPVPPAALGQEEIERLWGDLAGDDPAKALDAAVSLAADPAQAVDFLDKRLQAIPVVDDRKISQWITDLDNDQLEVREKAFQELERIGRRAEAMLQQALGGRPSSEFQDRAKALLQKLDKFELHGEKLQEIRALRVLERIGSPKACEILRRLAKGEPQVRLTLVTQASVSRLEKSGSVPPTSEIKEKQPTEKQPDEATAPPVLHRLPDDPFQPRVLLSRLGPTCWLTDTPVNFVAFGPGEKMISAGGEIFVWDRDTGQQFLRFGRYEKGLSGFSLSRSGKSLACSSHDSVIHLWDPSTGKETRQLRTGNQVIRCLAFSPDETMLVSGGDDKALEIWSVVEGSLIRRLAGHAGGCTSVAISPDGKNIASGGRDQLVRVWDVGTGEQLRELGEYRGERDAIAFSNDGSLLATEGLAHRIEIREVSSGKVIRTFRDGNSHVRSLHFSPTGKVLSALFAKWNTIIGWSLETGKVTVFCSEPLPMNSFAYSRGGLLLAAAGSDHSVRIFDAVRWRELPLKGGHTAPSTTVTFSPDDNTVTTAGRFSTIRKWDVTTGKELYRPKQPPGWHTPVAFSPDGKLGVSIRQGGRCELWDVSSGEVLLQVGKAEDSLQGFSFFPDNQTLATSFSNEIRFWDLAKRKQTASSKLSLLFVVTSMEFSPDGQRVVWPDFAQGGLGLRDPLTGKELEWLERQQFPFRPVIFSRNGKTLIASGQGVRIYELATLHERCMLTLDDRPFATGGLAVSPDGRILATSMERINLWSNINLWDLSTGKEIGRLVGQPGPSCLTFSHDGRYLASGSEKHGCLVWDLRKMARVQNPPAPSSQQLENLWAELAAPDAARAYMALSRLVELSDVAVDLIGKRVRPVTARPRIPQLIRDLDSDLFAVREKTFAELEALGNLAKPALQAELQKNPSPEFQARINTLLSKTPPVTVPPDQLRDWRALEILEFIGSTKAKGVLEILANGNPEARLTHDAKATLARLSMTPTP